ncbi:MAG: polysaccharide biosynthesis/export family protein [Bacteroidaceae bacterium]|nr:polysaccharide biosynthesis/export family protein [Bacteroidaceae bacterium]MBR7028823.1 polysaccharide biosynthesis/export family protein [Bacteroidaceae bacterium]
MKATRILFAALTVLCLTACVSQKKIVYFQGSESVYSSPQAIPQSYRMAIQPADRISLSITCSEPKLLAGFASNVTFGTNEAVTTGSSGNKEIYTGYTVDKDGYVTLPMIGKLKAQGKTEEEFATTVEKAIIAAGIVNDPQVTVKYTNARVSVLGAVNRPGTIPLNSQRTSVLDVLAAAGDISDNGLKTNLQLYREVDGKREMYVLDLTQADIFNSPAFYVQQNDVIYVSPNKAAGVKNSPFFTFWGASASIASVVISLTSLIIALTR